VANFTPLASLLGGILIGLAASMMLLFNGKIAGISGIVAGLLRPAGHQTLWRVLFVTGLVTGGLVLRFVQPAAYAFTIPRTTAALVAAGLLVGFGTRLGNGCTSGHGVCGISRLSARSIAATVVFIATGATSTDALSWAARSSESDGALVASAPDPRSWHSHGWRRPS
jgi:uncharacterized membrane protein YedE/YeeE